MLNIKNKSQSKVAIEVLIENFHKWVIAGIREIDTIFKKPWTIKSKQNITPVGEELQFPLLMSNVY